jgi:signal transduction histidine kinase
MTPSNTFLLRYGIDADRLIDAVRRAGASPIALETITSVRHAQPEAGEVLVCDARSVAELVGALDHDRRYRQVYRHMREAVALNEVVFDDEGNPVDYRILDANAAFETVFCRRASSVVGCLASEVYGSTPAPHLDVFVPVALGAEETILDLPFEALGRDLRVSVYSLYHGHFAMVFEDVSARHRLEEQVRQAQKMEAVGRLAGGVAHDFNNLLTVILGYADMALASIAEADPLHGTVAEIRASAERAAALTAGLLAFSRKQVVHQRVVDLAPLVTKMAPMLRRVIGEDIEMETVVGEHPIPVRADASQLEQVVMNLVVNARDAMPGGGRLVVRADIVNGGAADAAADAPPGLRACLTVADTGSGMDERTQAHMFDPFFTTKPAGQGTGLGLSTVFGIVNQAGGDIRVQSRIGEGTTFRVYLPLADGHDQTHAVLPPPAPATLGRGLVLLAEDDAAVRGLVRDTLEHAGYTVIDAENGIEALQVSQNEPRRIDLLVTDLMMPYMGGVELARRIREHRPEIQVLCLSGYHDEAFAARGGVPAASWLTKPFRPVELADKVSEILRPRPS